MNQLLTRYDWVKHTYVRMAVGSLALILALLKAIQEANGQDIHGDIYIFWSAGVNFLNGTALYSRIGGAEEFLYPPFAPMVFQLLALMPFPVAVGVFTFINFMLWVAIFRLTYLIVQHYYPADKLTNAFLFGFLATIRYFWHNISWVNINEVVAILSLGGVYLYIKGQETKGLVLITIAAWMKIMPILLIALFFIRRPVSTLVRVIVCSGVIFGLILAERGISRGYHDYTDFWHIALLPFLRAGKVYTDAISFSIPSMMAKLLTSAGKNFHNHRYNIANWSLQGVRRISLIAQVLVVSLTYWRVWISRQSKVVPLSILLLVYLTMLLVAGVTWEGHFVIMALILPAIYQMLTHTDQKRLRHWFIAIAISVSLLIYDTLGPDLYDYLQGFSVLTYLVLFLYGVTLRENWRTVQTDPPIVSS